MKKCNLCNKIKKDLVEVLWWVDKKSYLCKRCMRKISDEGGC